MAKPDDASTGSLRNCTTFPAIVVKFQVEGGGGESAILLGPYREIVKLLKVELVNYLVSGVCDKPVSKAMRRTPPGGAG